MSCLFFSPALLDGEDHNDIKDFLDDIGVKVLPPEKLINQSICPLYSQPNKPSIMKNRRHVRYIFKSWQKVTESERSGLEESISRIPILRAYKGIQRETSDFVVPCHAYLPQAYTGDDDLETYFSVYDGELWFVDNKYLTNKSDPKAWLQFLKAIGAMDTPSVIEKNIARKSKNYQEFAKELAKRNIKLENTTQCCETSIKDLYLHGLPQMLDKISRSNDVNLSRSVWQLLVKIVNPLPSDPWWQNPFFTDHFQGIYRWFYRTSQQKYFDATFYRQLQKTAWLPDEQGNLHSPDKCFVPTSKNQEILGDSVIYLHSDFDISTRPAQWLAKKLGMHLQADAAGVLDYLQILSQTGTSIEKIKPLYEFLRSEDEHLWRFEEEPLIFTPEPEPHWWRTDEVFWEDESAVFGDDRGYLKAHYSADLKSFFTTSLRVPERADSLDYVRRIQEIASVEKAEDVKVRERVKILYDCLWQSLRKGDSLLESEEWQEEWEQMRAGRCWLGKKGSEWDFFFLHELVWKDDDYRSRLLKDEIPFWTFDSDLLEFAKYLGVKGCYEVSAVEVECYCDQGEDQIWSEKVKNLYPYIYDFLNSPLLCEEYGKEKSTEILERLSVRRAQRLEVNYRLNGSAVPDPNPRQGFLDPKRGILWLGLEEDEEAYPDLIGDALQDNFRIDQLREFIKDLLPTANLSETALLNWERRGFQPDRCLSPPEPDSEEGKKNPSEPVDERCSCGTYSEEDSGTDNSDVETPTIQEDPETGNQNDDSTENESETATYQPHTGRDGTRPSEGKAINTPNRNQGTDHSRGRGSGRKDNTHMDETDTSPHARKKIENIGMEHARRHEEEQGCTVEDVSAENLGYDLRSTTPKGEIRYIEVKARDKRALVVLTSNEWDTAERLKDDYFLYVVLNASIKPEPYIIRNPTAVISPQQEVRYQVPLWQIMEHGEPV